MSKAAIRSLTHSGAQEWGAYGLTVNAYAPGPIDTMMCKLYSQSNTFFLLLSIAKFTGRQDIMGGAIEHPSDIQVSFR